MLDAGCWMDIGGATSSIQHPASAWYPLQLDLERISLLWLRIRQRAVGEVGQRVGDLGGKQEQLVRVAQRRRLSRVLELIAPRIVEAAVQNLKLLGVGEHDVLGPWIAVVLVARAISFKRVDRRPQRRRDGGHIVLGRGV